MNVFGLGGGDKAVLHDAVLEGPLTGAPIGTLPESYSRAVWLSSFREIELREQGATVQTLDAVDEVFAAYW